MIPWWRTVADWVERQRFRRAAVAACKAWTQEVAPWQQTGR